MKKFLISIILIINGTLLFAQVDTNRVNSIRTKLDLLKNDHPTITETIDISVGRIHLSEMLRIIAETSQVNLSIRDNFDCIVSCNFSKSSIEDLLLFLCSEYSLDIEVFGNIVSVFKCKDLPIPYEPVEIIYTSDSLLTFNFHNKKLADVSQKITSLTGENIVVPKELCDLLINGNALNVSISDAIDIISLENSLETYVVNGKRRLWCFSNSGGKVNTKRTSKTHDSRVDTDTTDIIYLHSRAVTKIREIIPDALLKNLVIIVSDEMNSVIIHGPKESVIELKEYIVRIDKKIPLVNMDVIIFVICVVAL